MAQLLIKKIASALLVGAIFGLPASAEEVISPEQDGVAISLIIDDLGNRREPGLEALSLPGPVAYSILPHTPYGRMIAERAHAEGKEVMLHLPMQSLQGNALGEGGLTLEMTELELQSRVREGLASVPHVVGINNHMGSLLTQQMEPMSWLMREIKARGGLFFIDSRTTDRTVAKLVAEKFNIAAGDRDVFLDNEPNPEAIRFQFQRLLSIARKKGAGIGIGHPYPETLAVLRAELAEPRLKGFHLIPVRKVMEAKKLESQATDQH